MDQEGDYDSALNAMLNCKQLLLAQEAPLLQESEALQKHLRSLAESLTREHFERWTAAGKAFATRKLAVLASFCALG